jgi:hypothetical protein
VQHNKTAHASIYFQPEPYKSIILNQQPPPGEVNARVSIAGCSRGHLNCVFEPRAAVAVVLREPQVLSCLAVVGFDSMFRF